MMNRFEGFQSEITGTFKACLADEGPLRFTLILPRLLEQGSRLLLKALCFCEGS
jgi:hypothetical protein